MQAPSGGTKTRALGAPGFTAGQIDSWSFELRRWEFVSAQRHDHRPPWSLGAVADAVEVGDRGVDDGGHGLVPSRALLVLRGG